MSKKEETKKVSKKEEVKESKVKETKKKDTKKDVKKETKKTNKEKTVKVKKESFLKGVRKEMKNVRWPLKKEMITYSVATLSFIVFFALFFAVCDIVIAGIKMLVA